MEQIFPWILTEEVEAAGYVKPEVIFVDATHIKSNANLKKKVRKAIPGTVKTYETQLFEEVNWDREVHDKKPFDGSKPPKKRVINASTTDGVFYKGAHRQCFAYNATPYVNETTL